VTGSITVTSNASGGAKVIALVGTGAAAAAHTVTLSWAPSTSTVVGYNVYVSTAAGNSYVKLTSNPVETLGYIDSGLQTAQVRYYVVTSVDPNNNESAFSSEVSAIVP
jgi:fibronectin type 3 domain-containing protein